VSELLLKKYLMLMSYLAKVSTIHLNYSTVENKSEYLIAQLNVHILGLWNQYYKIPQGQSYKNEYTFYYIKTVIIIITGVFWDAIPCSLVDCYQHYGGTLVTIDETTSCHIPEDRMFILNFNLIEMWRASVGYHELHWVHCKKRVRKLLHRRPRDGGINFFKES
jgi:hypothetical protein